MSVASSLSLSKSLLPASRNGVPDFHVLLGAAVAVLRTHDATHTQLTDTQPAERLPPARQSAQRAPRRWLQVPNPLHTRIPSVTVPNIRCLPNKHWCCGAPRMRTSFPPPTHATPWTHAMHSCKAPPEAPSLSPPTTPLSHVEGSMRVLPSSCLSTEAPTLPQAASRQHPHHHVPCCELPVPSRLARQRH